MLVSQIPTKYIIATRNMLKRMGESNVITDDEMQLVARFCEAVCDPVDTADQIAHNRNIRSRPL